MVKDFSFFFFGWTNQKSFFWINRLYCQAWTCDVQGCVFIAWLGVSGERSQTCDSEQRFWQQTGPVKRSSKIVNWPHTHISSEHTGIRSDFILYIKRLLKISFHILDNIQYHRSVDIYHYLPHYLRNDHNRNTTRRCLKNWGTSGESPLHHVSTCARWRSDYSTPVTVISL